MVIKYTKIFHCNTFPKFTLIGIFGLKTNHLATLSIGLKHCQISSETNDLF
jgi:hypothetical protein